MAELTASAAHPADLALSPHATADNTAALSHLLLLASRGDTRAFERFYDTTIAVAQVFVRRMVPDEDTDDVLADAYFSVWREANQHEPLHATPLTWLLQLVRRHALEALRRNAEREAERDIHAPSQPGMPAVSDDPGPPDLLASDQAGQRLHRALAALSAHERWVLALSYFRDLSHGQISEHTGLPLGTVKSLILRAHGKLRNALSG